VTLGGRVFTVSDFDELTVRQHTYVQRIVRATGLDKVVVMDGESDKQYLIRLQTAALDSGQAPELIGGFLLPEGKTERDWTPAMAREIGTHIGLCNTREDRELVGDLALQVAIGFFREGLELLNRLLSYSSREGASPAPEQSARSSTH